jgi:hypothetical protein
MAELHVQRKRNNNWWVWLLIAILIIAAAIYFYMNYYHKNNTGNSVTYFPVKPTPQYVFTPKDISGAKDFCVMLNNF